VGPRAGLEGCGLCLKFEALGLIAPPNHFLTDKPTEAKQIVVVRPGLGRQPLAGPAVSSSNPKCLTVALRRGGDETAGEAKEIADDANLIWNNMDPIYLSGN
jgi:hypothetical protein